MAAGIIAGSGDGRDCSPQMRQEEDFALSPPRLRSAITRCFCTGEKRLQCLYFSYFSQFIIRVSITPKQLRKTSRIQLHFALLFARKLSLKNVAMHAELYISYIHLQNLEFNTNIEVLVSKSANRKKIYIHIMLYT